MSNIEIGRNIDSSECWFSDSKEPYHPRCDIPQYQEKNGLAFWFSYCWTRGRFIRVVTDKKPSDKNNVYILLKNDMDTMNEGWTQKKDIVEIDALLEAEFRKGVQS